jgi:hypothetical protein
MRTAGYLLDLRGGTFFDAGKNTGWIQALPLGTYQHPLHGEIKITPDRVKRFAQNVKDKVRGQDLDIDYDHKEQDGRAAGWVRDAEARSDGLWLLVEFTDVAAKSIRSKEYRYFSPEFVDEWEHPKTTQKYQDVLFGGALTNRPFLKDILPINLSEVFAHDNPTKEGAKVDPKDIAKLLGLDENTPEAELMKALEARVAAGGGETEEEKTARLAQEAETKRIADEAKAKELETVGLSEEQIRKLSETSPGFKAMVERQRDTDRQLAELQVAYRLSETDKRLTRIQLGAKYAVPPSILEKMKSEITKAPVQLSETMLGWVEELCKTGLIELGERGKNRPSTDATSAAERFETEVKKLTEGPSKMTYVDAVTQVARDNEELFDEYRSEATMDQGGR